MKHMKTTLFSLTLILGLCEGQSLKAQDSKYSEGLYWTIELSQLNGFGRVNFQGNRLDYSASTIAISSSVGYSINPFHSVGLGAWVSSYSPFGNDNLALPFFAEYTYAFKAEGATPTLTARIGNSFKFGEDSEVEDGLFFNFNIGYRKLPALGRFKISPFVGLVLQQVKDDTAFVNTGSVQSPAVLITDDVTYKALELGLKFYLIR